jgi:hypothetical protein
MRLRTFVLGVLLALLVGTGITLAQGDLRITGFTTSPGQNSTGGGYMLAGTAGESQAQELAGNGYTLSGGFTSAPSSSGPPKTFLPLLEP